VLHRTSSPGAGLEHYADRVMSPCAGGAFVAGVTRGRMEGSVPNRTSEVSASGDTRRSDVRVRRLRRSDIPPLRELIQETPPLVAHSPYVFRLLADHFGGTCFVAVCDARLVGAALGFVSQEKPGILFLWILCTRTGFGQGEILGPLCRAMRRAGRLRGCRRVWFTLYEGSKASGELLAFAERFLGSRPRRRKGAFLRGLGALAGQPMEYLYEAPI
jgi:hypothetical protein